MDDFHPAFGAAQGFFFGGLATPLKFIGTVCRTQTMHRLLCFKRNFFNYFVFALRCYLRRRCTKSKKGLVGGIVNSYGLARATEQSG